LGFVKGICCPHYDEEPERIPYVKKSLLGEDFKSCLAIEGYAALHLVDGTPKYSVSFKEGTNCHNVKNINGSIAHEIINDTIKLDL
jgi:aminopeptidase N